MANSTFQKAITDAITNATVFTSYWAAVSLVRQIIADNEWDVPGMIQPDMLTEEMLRIEPERVGLTDADRRLLVLGRLGAGLKAYGAMDQFFNTLVPDLTNPEAPIRDFAVDLATLGSGTGSTRKLTLARGLDVANLTILRAIRRMGTG